MQSPCSFCTDAGAPGRNDVEARAFRQLRLHQRPDVLDEVMDGIDIGIVRKSADEADVASVAEGGCRPPDASKNGEHQHIIDWHFLPNDIAFVLGRDQRAVDLGDQLKLLILEELGLDLQVRSPP